MKTLHVNVTKDVEVCTPQAHPNRYRKAPHFAFKAGKLVSPAIFACLMFSPLPAHSQSADTPPTTGESLIEETMKEQLEFADPAGPARGQFCQIVLSNDGALHEIPGAFKLSSKGAGGRPGVAQITASNSSFRVSVDQPLGFVAAPTGGNTGVVMQASFAGYGASNFSETPDNIEQKIKRGTTRIETHLTVSRTGSPFPAGNYTAELTLRCE